MFRRHLPILLIIACVAGFIAFALYWPSRPGVVHTTTISIVDANTNAPIPITVNRRRYAGADPWQTKIAPISPGVVQVQWTERASPASVYVDSPGYQGIGIDLNYRQRSLINIGLW